MELSHLENVHSGYLAVNKLTNKMLTFFNQ